MWIFHSTGARAPNPHFVQESAVFNFSSFLLKSLCFHDRLALASTGLSHYFYLASLLNLQDPVQKVGQDDRLHSLAFYTFCIKISLNNGKELFKTNNTEQHGKYKRISSVNHNSDVYLKYRKHLDYLCFALTNFWKNSRIKKTNKIKIKKMLGNEW